MVRNYMENGILINYMDAQRWNGQMVKVGGGNSRMIRQKDMEQDKGLMETDTSGNTWIVTGTGMEYTDGLMDMYITESGNRIRLMAKDISGWQMDKNIAGSGRMACDV
jgi:hypothetical protein